MREERHETTQLKQRDVDAENLTMQEAELQSRMDLPQEWEKVGVVSQSVVLGNFIIRKKITKAGSFVICQKIYQ